MVANGTIAHLRLALAGTAYGGQHVAQFPLVVQHRPAAGVRGGDRHDDPQRPAQPALGAGGHLPVHGHQRMHRQRLPGRRLGQRLPRQPAEPGRVHPYPYGHELRRRSP